MTNNLGSDLINNRHKSVSEKENGGGSSFKVKFKKTHKRVATLPTAMNFSVPILS